VAHERAGKPAEPAPVKYLVAVLLGQEFDVASLLPDLEAVFGKSDFVGGVHDFDRTDYYEDEMGPVLERFIISFAELRPATELVGLKLRTYEIEQRLGTAGCRRANIDPGYLDFHKLVLASFKEGPQKIYLGEGVWADPILLYQHGEFRTLPWTFPDFKAGIYTEDLTAVRERYREQMKGR
jgi:hypothetical protein